MFDPYLIFGVGVTLITAILIYRKKRITDWDEIEQSAVVKNAIHFSNKILFVYAFRALTAARCRSEPPKDNNIFVRVPPQETIKILKYLGARVSILTVINYSNPKNLKYFNYRILTNTLSLDENDCLCFYIHDYKPRPL